LNHLAFGWYLMCAGRIDQSHEQLEKAQELDPGSRQINRARGTLLLYSRQFDRAINYFLKRREAEPTAHRTHLLMSVAYEKTGREAEAVEEALEHGRSLGFLTSEQIGLLRKSFKTSGWHGYLRSRIVLLEERSKTEYVSPNHMAGFYSLLGEKDHAFAWLEKTFDERDPAIVKIKIEPIYDNLRSDPRFTKLLQRMNLTP
jgi:adenylate cyclase